MYFLATPRCNAVTDIGFIIDTNFISDDLGKTFLKTLVGKLDLSGGVRTSIISFSSGAPKLHVKFDETADLAGFVLGPIELPDTAKNALPVGSTQIDKALRLAREKMFTKRNGARFGVPKMLVFLHDGTQTVDEEVVEDLGPLSKDLRAMGVPIIVVGVGESK